MAAEESILHEGVFSEKSWQLLIFIVTAMNNNCTLAYLECYHTGEVASNYLQRMIQTVSDHSCIGHWGGKAD